MNLQKQPNKWSCLPTSLAMVLHVPVSEIIIRIGHDGSAIIDEGAPEPYNRRSFHIQEIYDVAWAYKFMIMPIEKESSIITGADKIINLPHSDTRFFKYMKDTSGIITGIGDTGIHHAVAWDGQVVYDPNGQKYNLSRFFSRDYYLVKRIN